MAANALQLELTTLTPLWTGGADKKSDKLHVTGIMGSLRWWYEVFVRSVGGNVCDPGEHGCLYDLQKPYDGLCDVCRVFGATGWSRRFKLIISGENLQQRKPQASRIGGAGNLEFNLSSDHPSFNTSGHKWYLPGNPLYGDVTLNIIPTAPLDKDGNYLGPKIIGSLLQFIADRASLGAKPQMGLGVVSLAQHQSLVPLIDHLERIVAKHQQKGDLKSNIDEELPCLQNMFFARINVASPTESDTFDLKYDLRGMFREQKQADPSYNDSLRHTIMGYVKGSNRTGSKIMMSYPYGDGTIRLWGWIPRLSQSTPSRDNILTEIYYFLEEAYGKDKISFWLDYDPGRDGAILNYLEKSFLEGGK